jgi:signal transduction histidine kinase
MRARTQPLRQSDQCGEPDAVNSLRVLTASIAHEVNQPLSGIITNASTCLRMLSAEPPNLDGARGDGATRHPRREPGCGNHQPVARTVCANEDRIRARGPE